MKIQLQSTITRLAENQFGVAVTAVVPTGEAAVELRRWIEGAVKEAAGKAKLEKTNSLILPANWRGR